MEGIVGGAQVMNTLKESLKEAYNLSDEDCDIIISKLTNEYGKKPVKDDISSQMAQYWRNIEQRGDITDAPDWANYKATDQNGNSWWYSHKPYPDDYNGQWLVSCHSVGNRWERAQLVRAEHSPIVNYNWIDSLVELDNPRALDCVKEIIDNVRKVEGYKDSLVRREDR
jgi:hypothetical protein